MKSHLQSLQSGWRVSRQTVAGASRSVFILSLLLTTSAPAIIDTNTNGVSDLWEQQHNNGNLIPNFDPQADPDSDGWTNAQEAASGTDPFNPNPPDGFIRPEIVHIPAMHGEENGESVVLTPEAVTLTWPTLPGKQYILHYSPDLTEASWRPVEAPYIGNGSITEYGIPLTQPDGSAPDKLFWRVAVNDIDADGDGLTSSEEAELGTNPNASDTDFDGIADNLDPTPLANNAIADPDGGNLPVSLATRLTGRWDLEAIATNNGVRTSHNTANPSIPAYLGGAIEANNNGMVSNATRMSAMNQYIRTDPSVITGNASFSISLWFRFEKNYLQNKQGTLNTVLFAFNDVLDASPQFQLHAYKSLSTLGTQKLVFSHYDNTIIYPDLIGEIPMSAPLDDGNWQHLTLTKSSGSIRIYRNSQQLVSGGSHSGVLVSSANGYLCFGALVPSPLVVDTNFRGSMDRIRSWSRAITQSEITALYQQDIDRDGLWDITENKTRYSDYQGTVVYHPDPANPTAPQPTQTGYARSPFLHSSAALDFDQDELSDLAEQAAGTGLTTPDTDSDNLTDGFEISHNFNPLNAYSLGATGPRDDLGDPDLDTLTTLTEYFNGSNPRHSNSDGDGKSDAAEIAQGSDPANAADSGAAPQDPPEPVPFHINGDYTAWEATLKGKGPNDTRTRRIRMSAHNVAADQTLNLLRGNAYELSLRYIRTKPGESVPWYCWEASIDGKSTPAFTIADHWVVDNSSALLAAHTHSHGTNLVADKKVNLLPVEIKAYRPEMVQQSVDLRPSDQSKLVIPDAEELNPGVRIRVNRDDDDYDSPYRSDADEDSVSGENDLIKVEFSCPALAGMTDVKVFLKRSNSKLRAWEAKEKGTAILKEEDEKELILNAQGAKTIWVEAIDEGEGELEWQLKSGSNVVGTAANLKFITYKSLLVGMSGETFGTIDPKGNGMFDVCQKLYLEGYNIAYYDTYGTNTTSGDPAYREAGFQIWKCFVRELGIFGHSHGGGDVYIISNKLNITRSSLGPFNISFSGYVDAIEHDSTADNDSEIRHPPSSLYHWNYYQRQSLLSEAWLRGNSVTGAALNLNVNTTVWGAALTHTSIDGSATVQKDLHATMKSHVTP